MNCPAGSCCWSCRMSLGSTCARVAPHRLVLVSQTQRRPRKVCRLDDHDYISRRSLGGTGRSACQDCFLVLNIKHTIHESNKTQKFWYQLLAPSYRLSLLSLSGLNSKHTLHGEHGWRLHKERRRTYMMNLDSVCDEAWPALGNTFTFLIWTG